MENINSIFIDESGTNKNDGFATIALVIVEHKNISKISDIIIKAESIVDIGPFHWSHYKWPMRKRFFIETLIQCRAHNVSAIVIIKKHPIDFYNITMDGEKSRSYERRLKMILRENNISTRVLSIARDESTPILRLSDGIAGLVRYHFDKPDDATAKEILRFLKNNIEIKIYVL